MCIYHYLEKLFAPIALLGARIMMFWVFFNASYYTKIQNWPGTLFLFEHEYKVPIIPHEIAAYLATSVELVGSVCLLLGLFVRPFAAAFIGMTMVIEFLVYPGTTDHYYWFVLLAVLLSYGGGALSIDHMARKWYEKK